MCESVCVCVCVCVKTTPRLYRSISNWKLYHFNTMIHILILIFDI